MEGQVQIDSKSDQIIKAHQSLVQTIRTELPKVDSRLVLDMLMHEYIFHEEQPKIRLEIVYAESVNSREKKKGIYARTGRVAEIRDEYILIIDGYFTLQDIENFAKDDEIEMIKGGIIA